MNTLNPLILIIMDGFGLSNETKGNAIHLAKTPNLDYYFKTYPFSRLDAAGEPVGLPNGFQGSSEVGHLNMGSGRIVLQEEVVIDKAIENKSFQKNKAFLDAINHAKSNNTNLHIMGLLQDQGVHSLQNHLFELIKLCSQHDVKPLLHIFTDGRDTLPKSAEVYFNQLQKVINKYPATIATITGRYYAMDRDNRWDRINLAYDAITYGNGDLLNNWQQALKFSYKLDETDEFIKPKIMSGYGGIKENDSMIFFNYRADRARQLTKAYIDPEFKEFGTKKINLKFVTMSEYYKGMPAQIAFVRHLRKNIFAKVLQDNQIKQLRIAETEKYAHVTFFFNDEVEVPYLYEDRKLIPSPKVATYDLQPEMSAFKITKEVIKDINENKHKVYILNFANCDMVGHTGKIDATISAVETVDTCVHEVVKAIIAKNGAAIITADHGNAEKMIDDSGVPFTSHTINKVPCCLINTNYKSIKDGKLGDLAPTMLKLLKIKQPKEMTGKSLI